MALNKKQRDIVDKLANNCEAQLWEVHNKTKHPNMKWDDERVRLEIRRTCHLLGGGGNKVNPKIREQEKAVMNEMGDVPYNPYDIDVTIRNTPQIFAGLIDIADKQSNPNSMLFKISDGFESQEEMNAFHNHGDTNNDIPSLIEREKQRKTHRESARRIVNGASDNVMDIPALDMEGVGDYSGLTVEFPIASTFTYWYPSPVCHGDHVCNRFSLANDTDTAYAAHASLAGGGDAILGRVTTPTSYDMVDYYGIALGKGHYVICTKTEYGSGVYIMQDGINIGTDFENGHQHSLVSMYCS